MKTRDKIGILFWVATALLVCIGSSRLPWGSLDSPGPGFLPLLSGIVLGVLSIIAYIGAYLAKPQQSETSVFPKERWRNLLLVLIGLFLYAVSMESLGFLLATFFLLIVLFRGVEPQKWTVSILGSALISFVVYIIFNLCLGARLPKGILGF